MQKLIDAIKHPTGFDSMANYIGEIPEDKWLVLLTRSRDSDCLTESNWVTILKALGGEGENVQIDRFGHWACGWWESLSVNSENADILALAEDIERALEYYPVFDDEDFAEREREEADQVWRDCYNRYSRAEYIRKHRAQFDFRDFADLKAVVNGDYFAGCASELIY